MCVNRLNNRSRLNARNNLGNDNSRSVGIAHHETENFILMSSLRDLWQELCSYDNLFLAYTKARKHKTRKDYIIEFEKNLKDNLLLLRSELSLHCYDPKPLVNFTIHDPKMRKISKSDFRDRVIHHALCNIIEPIFEKTFIYDSYANRINKGALKAIDRFDRFKRKVTRNNTLRCYVLKADIRKYFDNIEHEILLSIIKKRIFDKRVIWLIRKILANPSSSDKGMPLGNLTSQFFANVYLNELDYFVKHKLKARYYIRYVDDFVIFNTDAEILEDYKRQINLFLREKLDIELHPEKSKVLRLSERLTFLGFRIFYHHKLLKKSNMVRMKGRIEALKQEYAEKKMDYDSIYDFLEGWIAYAKNADTYNLRKRIMAEVSEAFCGEISTKEINRFLKE
ncbi:MAG TPA: reverse transcriptase/maturase family protein [Candidatus Nanoarchaeia archaeon]|nr:hypothetical protein [uncultured archaeon]HLC46537.1 reverse transcriptase/maturase family protein [Candidatus Nanoarchaeia archaeon]